MSGWFDYLIIDPGILKDKDGNPIPRDPDKPVWNWFDPGTWINDDGAWNYLAFQLSKLPVVGDIGYMADSTRSFMDYMKNNGLTWADITYPWMAGRQYGGGTVQSLYGSVNFVSSNLRKLYR